MKRIIDGADLAGKLRTRKANAVGHAEAMDAYENALNDAIDAEELSLNTLRDEVYQDAVAHGLWEVAELAVAVECAWVGTEWKECLLRSAGADKIWDEALELDRAWKNSKHYAEELADVIIMSLSVAGKLGIDIDAAVRNKIAYNKTRPWKHEGEKHEG